MSVLPMWHCSDSSRDEQKWASCSWLLLRHLAKLPEDRQFVSYNEARQIMTRADFLDPLDGFQVSDDA